MIAVNYGVKKGRILKEKQWMRSNDKKKDDSSNFQEGQVSVFFQLFCMNECLLDLETVCLLTEHFKSVSKGILKQAFKEIITAAISNKSVAK